MKRLGAAVTVTVTLCLFVLFVTREPASTATRAQVPRGEQAGAMSPMLDTERQPNGSTDPPESSGSISSSSTWTEPTSTTLSGTESTSESSTPPTTTTMPSSTSETTTVVSTLATTSASTAPVTITAQPSPTAAPNTPAPISSATPPVETTNPPDHPLLSVPPTPPWLAQQPQPPVPLIERDAATDFTQPPMRPGDTTASSAPQVRQTTAPARSTLATVSVRPTESPIAFAPDALAPTTTADAESMSIAVLAIIGGSLAAAALAMALIRRRPGKHRG